MKIYRIANTVNGKSYIGMTMRDVWDRVKQHRMCARNGSHHALHRAIAKYGWDKFTVEILYEGISKKEIQAVERGLIAQYGTYKPGGYNLTSGGEGAPDLTPESKLRAAEKRKNYVTSDETRRKISATLTGSKRDPEAVKKASAKLRGRKYTPEHIENIKRGRKVWIYVDSPRQHAAHAVMRGQPRDPKLVEATASKIRGRKYDEDHREKISAALIGKPKSAAARQKMSAAKKGKKPWNWKGWQALRAVEQLSLDFSLMTEGDDASD